MTDSTPLAIDPSADLAARFEREGFLALPQLTDAEDVAFLREAYDRLFAARAGRELGDHFDLAGPDGEDDEASLPQILHPARHAPELLQARLLARATLLARALLGADAHCFFAHAISKPPHTGAPTPWHQDAAYWPPEHRYRSISIWVPLQEATAANGCMEFVPRSHALDVLPHRSIGGDPRVHGLELAPDALHHVRNAVRCPLAAGGATVHGPYLLHAAGPNRSDAPRRALILNAGLPPTPRAEPLRFPWLEEQDTARARRAHEAARHGLGTSAVPSGAPGRDRSDR